VEKQEIVLAIVGSREFEDFEYMKACIEIVRSQYNIRSIVSGGARGADSLGVKLAIQLKVPYKEFLPDWSTHGKVAGFIRNKDIVEACDVVAAFPIGESRGTRNTIKQAKKANKRVFIWEQNKDTILPSILDMLA
jgi:predicted Rossmann fold nucleotide-binding protein DprA/Smf involved in DNA uptake